MPPDNESTPTKEVPSKAPEFSDKLLQALPELIEIVKQNLGRAKTEEEKKKKQRLESG
jgi:hypothetical protein